MEDYDEYCHYVAGLVGLGLSRLFHASGLEVFQPDDLSNSMGLFLQVLPKNIRSVLLGTSEHSVLISVHRESFCA